jgi:hypothetical protein
MYYFHGIGGVTKRQAATQFLLLCCLAILFCLMLFGLIRYTSGPIRKRSDGRYRDKNGHEFTEAQFRAFKIWEGSLACSLGSVVAVGIADAAAKRGHNRGGEL